MRGTIAYWTVLLVGLTLLIIAAMVLFVTNPRFAPTPPKCPEDVVLLGGGDYRDGHWDYLYCGPAVDDL